MEKLIAGLRYFRENLVWQRQEAFERSVKGQKPFALLVACSDSRVLPETLMQADPGDVFVARNAGNLIPPPDTPSGEAATVEYAVAALGVTDIIVCGHYRCGAVNALLHPEQVAGLPKVAEWLAHAAESRTVMERDHPHLEGESRWDTAVEQNVLVQVQNLSRHPVVAAGLAAGTLRLHAWVLRFESGDVVAYDPHAREFRLLLDMPFVHAVLPTPGECCEPPVPVAVPTPAPSPPKWTERLRADFAASLVVFMVALPLCLAIARASGVPAEVGLLTGVVGGVLVGLLTGSPLQVSGPTAGLIVVLIDVVQQHGVGRLGTVVLLAGLIQLGAAAFRLGQWFRAVSPAVVAGMLAGMGVVIFAQQFHVALDDQPSRSPFANLAGLPHAVANVFDANGHAGHPEHRVAAVTGGMTLAVLLLWSRIAPRRLKWVPPVLVAVTLATAATVLLGLPIQRVELAGLSAAVTWPDLADLPRLLADVSVWQVAVVVALLASAEALLCAAAVDQMHNGPRTRYDRELAAQGMGNAVCGILGLLPLTGVAVRSSANVQAGARTRWATVLHGCWLLAFVLLLPGLFRLIPTAALAAVLVLAGIRLIDIKTIRGLWRESRAESAICLATAVAVVAVNLLAGVLIGVGLSVAKLVYTFSRLRVRRRGDPASGRLTLVLEGSATFIRLPRLAAALDAIPPGVALHVDFKALSYIDHACLNLLIAWERRHAATGGTLTLDWDILQARFRTARPRPRQDGTTSNQSPVQHR